MSNRPDAAASSADGPRPGGAAPWLARFGAGDRRALARLLTFVSQEQHLEEIDGALASAPRRAEKTLIVAVTGGGGVGKSTLIGRLIEHLRQLGETVAVLACDPQSSVTGGSLLGDRVRMPLWPDDEGVFIRSLATPAGRQAVAGGVERMTRILAARGFANVIVETVGAGQGDVAVRDLADVVVVVVQPEAGDDLQWAKAGVLEVADVIVVNKGDLPGAEATVSQLREQFSGAPGDPIIVCASAGRRQGIAEVWEAVRRAAAKPSAQGGPPS